MTYQITNVTSGQDLGAYDGASEAEAICTMYRDAGYSTLEEVARDLGVTIEELLGDLRVVATKAGELADEQDAACSELRDAETALLDAVIESVRPGLRSVSSRIQKSCRTWWPDNVAPVEEDEYLKDRGLRVCGDGAGVDHPSAQSGAYEGEDLYLLQDGTWLGLTYTGHWSCWQGVEGGWLATSAVLTTAEVTKNYQISIIINNIHKALDRQVSGKREKATKRARDRAKTMRALTTLLGGQS